MSWKMFKDLQSFFFLNNKKLKLVNNIVLSQDNAVISLFFLRNKMIRTDILIYFVKIFMLKPVCYSHALSSRKILEDVTLQAC